MDNKDLGKDFQKSVEERGRAEEARWAREQDQEALRRLRAKITPADKTDIDKTDKESGSAPPKP